MDSVILERRSPRRLFKWIPAPYQSSNPTLGPARWAALLFSRYFLSDEGRVNSSSLPKRAFIDSLSLHFQYIKNQVHDIKFSSKLCLPLLSIRFTGLRVNSNPEVDPSALINAIGRLKTTPRHEKRQFNPSYCEWALNPN